MRIQMKAALQFIVLLLIKLQYTLSQRDDYCNKYYIGNLGEGVIYSDNYPFNYREGRVCHHKIYFSPHLTNSNRTICFTFHRFDLYEEWRDHYLQFSTDTDLIKYSGYGLWVNRGPEVSAISNAFSPHFCWTTSSNIYDVKFQSTHIFNNRGYYATFKILDRIPEGYALSKHSTEVPSTGASSTGASSTMNTSTTSVPTTTSNAPRIVKRDTCTPISCHNYCYYGFEKDQFGCDTCDCVASGEAPCGVDAFTCFDRQCIPLAKRCNNVKDCPDGSDEGYMHARCPGWVQQITDACDFETGLCGLVSEGWVRDYRSPYGLHADHTIGTLFSGHFMYSAFTKDKADAELTAVLPLSFRSEHARCLSFWYFMAGYVGTLKVYVVGGDKEAYSAPTWHRKGHAGSDWVEAGIDLPPAAFPIHQVIFHSAQGTPNTGDIAMDDISILNTSCVGDDHSCSFELGLCGWSHDEGGEARWLRWTGPTQTAHTGINEEAYVDTPGGYYLLLDASDHQSGEKARLISRTISKGHSGSMCLTFKYFMHGRYVNFLKVRARHYDGQESVQWSQIGEHGETWLQASVSLSAIEGPFQLIFEATRGYNQLSDIAIDDILIIQRHCNLEPELTTSTTTTERHPLQCSEAEWQCDNGQCINSGLKCDGNYNCKDSSDELDCDGQSTSIGTVIGITVSLILAVILVIIIIIFIFRRKRLFPTGQGRRSAPRPQVITAYPHNVPIVCRTDADPMSMSGQRFTCTEPPPPYTAVDNHGFSSDGSVRSPVSLGDLPRYDDVALGSLPRYGTAATTPTGQAAPPQQTVAFSSGVIGPESVGGEVPLAVHREGAGEGGEQSQRPNLPTRPTLSGYGANTVTISYGSAYEPPPTYDISIVARPSQNRDNVRERGRNDAERDSREEREASRQRERSQERRRLSKEQRVALPTHDGVAANVSNSPSSHNVPMSGESSSDGATSSKSLIVNLPSTEATVSANPLKKRNPHESRSDDEDFSVYDNPTMLDTSSETTV